MLPVFLNKWNDLFKFIFLTFYAPIFILQSASYYVSCLPQLILFIMLFWQAWSSIVYKLIPNVKELEQSLNQFANIIDGDEVLLFERATFLVISHCQRRPHRDVHRFEKVSNIIKQFKLSCRYVVTSYVIYIHLKKNGVPYMTNQNHSVRSLCYHLSQEAFEEADRSCAVSLEEWLLWVVAESKDTDPVQTKSDTVTGL